MGDALMEGLSDAGSLPARSICMRDIFVLHAFICGTNRTGYDIWMIDFHTHVLPGIDDGSVDQNMTKQMLLMERGQGVDHVVATPHFYADHISVKRFLEKRAAAFAKVKELQVSMEKSALPKLSMGAEVYYFPGMGSAEQLKKLMIGESGTVLIELPFEQWSESVYQDVRDVIERQRLRVVLAHIERYVEFQRDRSVWERIFALPLIPQINAGSFAKHRGGLFRRDRRRQFCLEFLSDHPRLILGSDCHNLTGRKPNLKEGRDAIEAALGRGALEMIDDVSEEVLV